jgi:hypothetical protein
MSLEMPSPSTAVGSVVHTHRENDVCAVRLHAVFFAAEEVKERSAREHLLTELSQVIKSK